jgi:two-component system osmolarity sensor histidine kinase EnvZ
MWVKRILPRSLFGRWLLLLVTPVVALQIVVTYVFYQAHWDTVTRRLALSVANEISLLIEARDYFPEAAEEERFLRLVSRNVQLDFSFEPGGKLPANGPRPRFYSILDTMLNQALRERLYVPFQTDTRRNDEKVEIVVQLEAGLLRVLTLEKRLFSTTTYLFVMWMVGTSVLLLSIAILFLRNQVRPIRRLAEAAEAFGKGRDIPDFRLAGATEVRQAAAAFIAMRERINRQIEQRTAMLAGVSHDLRTALTRMKLGLALAGQSPEVGDLQRDVGDMEKILDSYLDFAKGEDGEALVATDLPRLLSEVIADMRRLGGDIRLTTVDGLVAPVRPVAFKRCLTNLMENALRHGNRVEVSAVSHNGSVEVAIDDDGPGVPWAQREDVFRPFFTLDPARNLTTGGVGLGLTIARDIVRRHGGDILLSSAPIGGLRALVKLPV